MPSVFSNPIMNTRRYLEVLEVLARHGFASIIVETGLDHMIEKGREWVGLPNAEEALEHLPIPVRLRHVLEELGPTYIKMGQVLSTRPDLVTSEVALEFRKLQSNAPKVPFEKIQERLDEEFGDSWNELFDHIDNEPLAAASMAQTHRARLKTGEDIVLKILRPDIEQILESDMSVMKQLARITERRFSEIGFSPTAVVREFTRQLKKELDLMQEGHSIERLQKAFKDDPRIKFTKVYWEASTPNILALEEVHGTLLSNLKPEDLTKGERMALVEAGTDAVFFMCLEYGFFHADPHPGNIFYLGNGNICFIDFGMTGHIEERLQDKLADLVNGVISRDLDRVVRTTIDLADADPTLETDRTFRADVWELVSRFHTGSLENLDIAALLNSFFDLLQSWHIQLPGDLVFLIKALTTIQGVGEEIEPDFDLVGHVKPMMNRLVMRQFGPKALYNRLQKTMMEYAEFLEELPHELRFIAAELRRRKFSIRLQLEQLPELKSTIDSSGKLISLAMLLSAVILGATNLSAAGGTFFTALGIIALLSGTFVAVWIMMSLKK